jgi:hypothetical protein
MVDVPVSDRTVYTCSGYGRDIFDYEKGTFFLHFIRYKALKKVKINTVFFLKVSFKPGVLTLFL